MVSMLCMAARLVARCIAHIAEGCTEAHRTSSPSSFVIYRAPPPISCLAAWSVSLHRCRRWRLLVLILIRWLLMRMLAWLLVMARMVTCRLYMAGLLVTWLLVAGLLVAGLLVALLLVALRLRDLCMQRCRCMLRLVAGWCMIVDSSVRDVLRCSPSCLLHNWPLLSIRTLAAILPC